LAPENRKAIERTKGYPTGCDVYLSIYPPSSMSFPINACVQKRLSLALQIGIKVLKPRLTMKIKITIIQTFLFIREKLFLISLKLAAMRITRRTSAISGGISKGMMFGDMYPNDII